MFTDIMVDLETTGTDPHHCAIIQLAAVKWNPLTGDVCPDTFDQALQFAPNRFWEEGGRDFWRKLPNVYQALSERSRNPVDVLRDFNAWVLKDQPDDLGYRFWAKPTTFDWSFLASYYRQFGMHMPFHYRHARDVNSYLAGLRSNPEHVTLEEEIHFEGQEHNALWDCFHQIQVVLMAQDKWGIVDAQSES
jgi:inhibitor of KinA sporulation pathway (predicted exonuclease)